MKILGQGTYHRDPRNQFEGLSGHFDVAPDGGGPLWQGETTCA